MTPVASSDRTRRKHRRRDKPTRSASCATDILASLTRVRRMRRSTSSRHGDEVSLAVMIPGSLTDAGDRDTEPESCRGALPPPVAQARPTAAVLAAEQNGSWLDAFKTLSTKCVRI